MTMNNIHNIIDNVKNKNKIDPIRNGLILVKI